MKKLLSLFSLKYSGIAFLMFFLFAVNNLVYYTTAGIIPTYFESVVSQTNDINSVSFGIMFAYAILIAGLNNKCDDLKADDEFKKLGYCCLYAVSAVLMILIASVFVYILATSSWNVFKGEAVLFAGRYNSILPVFAGSLLLMIIRFAFLAYLLISLRRHIESGMSLCIILIMSYFDWYLVLIRSTSAPDEINLGRFSLFDYQFTAYSNYEPEYLWHVIFWVVAFALLIGVNYAVNLIGRRMVKCKNE